MAERLHCVVLDALTARGCEHAALPTDRPETLRADMEYACLNWFLSGKLEPLPAEIDVERLPRGPVANSREYRQGLIAAAALLGDRNVLDKAIALSTAELPPTSTFPLYGIPEVLHWARSEFSDEELNDQQFQLAWSWEIAERVINARPIAPLLSLCITKYRGHDVDLMAVVRERMRELDEDIYGREGRPARIELSDRTYAVIRRPRPGVQVTQAIRGDGGRIVAGLPMVLREALIRAPQFLMGVTKGIGRIKVVRGARSKKDLTDLLSREDSIVSIKLKMDGDVTIEDADLATYRARLETMMVWLHHFVPGARARSELILD